MNISHQQSADAVFKDLDLAKRKRRNFLPPINNPLIGIPIAQRLVLGFLIPALIAALAASIIGIQSAQLLNQESGFYQHLFQSYSSLTTGNDFLQLMNFKLNATLSDAMVNPSHTQLTADQQAVQGLETRYETLLQDYDQHDLLIHNPSQTALFDGAGHPPDRMRSKVCWQAAQCAPGSSIEPRRIRFCRKSRMACIQTRRRWNSSKGSRPTAMP